MTTLEQQAFAFAQQVEQDTFRMANLSVQELIDCDDTADQGCTGGNPLLAFFYIHQYGLTTWQEYPYQATEGTCRMDLVSHPMATVTSWGLLPKNYEHAIALTLRYLGPVAVGVNGGDPAFISYMGGIFDKINCSQTANHAMLIVGYGQEEIRNRATGNQEVVKYWIVRNSWGTGWGEKGFVRVKRGDGKKGTRGVCGIAKSPSVALGGLLLPKRQPPILSQWDDEKATSSSESTVRKSFLPFCQRLIWQEQCNGLAR